MARARLQGVRDTESSGRLVHADALRGGREVVRGEGGRVGGRVEGYHQWWILRAG